MKFYRVLIMVAALAVCAAAQTATPVFNTGQAARLVIGQVNFTAGNYGATNQLLGTPSGIAYANGTLWVADSNRLGGSPNNNRVLRFSDTATYPTPTQDPTVAGSTCGVCRGQASLVLGQPDYISSGFALTPTGMRSPTAVATDGTILVVADTDNNRVLIWHHLPAANDVPPDTVIGQPDLFHGATAIPPTASSLRGPEGVWLAGGKLFIADTQDNRILIYNQVPTTNNVAANVVVGQPSFTSFVQPDLTQAANATTAANNMQTPVSVTTDATHMYVADLGQNRVLIFNSIPTTNGVAADVVVGQPTMAFAVSNYSYNSPATQTLDADGNIEGLTPALCNSDAAYAANQGQVATNVTDTNGTILFPTRCAATLDLPRMALSDGTRLFVADGGNDRVLVFNTIPTQNGQRADIVLGEPDEYSDNTGENPDGANAFQTPTSMAWDSVNQNLYVSDSYNRRIVVYTPGVLNIPLSGVRNAASLEIFALGSVSLAGTITAKDTITVTVNGTGYTYTVLATDTLITIMNALVTLINKAPDPNVIASADSATTTIVLTARVAGANGANITFAATTSVNATETATASGSNLDIYLENPSLIAPGTLIQVYGQNLCDSTVAASLSAAYLPFNINGCELFIDGQRAPLLYVSPTQVNSQMPNEYTDRSSVSLYMRTTHADGSITVTAPIAVTVPSGNPGIFAQYGSDPRPGYVYHAFSAETDIIAVGGTFNAGDVGTITIGSANYSYTVQAGDSIASVTANLVNLINNAPDPNVRATMTNQPQYSDILLTALVPGPGPQVIPVNATVAAPNPVPAGSSGTVGLVLTALNTAACCANEAGAPVTAANPAVPGEILYVLATGLGPTNPSDQNTGQIFQGGSANPPGTPVDTVQIAGTDGSIVNVGLVPGLVGVYYVQFQIPSVASTTASGATSLTTDSAIQMHIAQGSNISNVVTFPVVVAP